MKSTTGIILGVLALVLVIWGLASLGGKSENGTAGGKGNLYVSVKDQTAAIAGVSEVEMEIKKVELYSAADGWTTVSGENETYPLLAMKASGEARLYAQAEVDAKVYDRIRVTLGDTNVKTSGNTSVKAVLPSNHVVINSDVNVTAGESTNLTLDFMADRSLHVAKGGGKYIFTPTVNAQSRSGATVTVTGEDTKIVTTTGGRLDSNVNVGVDLEGASRPNFSLTPAVGEQIEIKSTAGSTINFLFNGEAYTADTSVEQDDVTLDIDTDVNSSLNLDADLDDDDGTPDQGSGESDGIQINGGASGSGSGVINY